MLDSKAIGFRALAMEDLPLLHRWLNETPIVKDIYAHGKSTTMEQVIAKYGPRVRGEMPTRCYLITYGGLPIGYIQTYLWRDYPAPYLDLQEEAAGVDLYIGEERFLYQGLGRPILRSFLRQIVFADESVVSCLITPEVRNSSALRAYEKAGFTRLRVVEDGPDEPGPICLMRIGREVVVLDPPPRCQYLTEQLTHDQPMLPDDLGGLELPEPIVRVTGPVRQVELLKRGEAHRVAALEAEQGRFILKVAQGGYRSQELWAEHRALQVLQGGPSVPVPLTLAFARQGDLGFQLRAHVPGQPLSLLLAGDEATRPEAIRQMGRALAKIHAIRPTRPDLWTWSDWVAASLECAAANLAAGRHDPEDFAPDEGPAQVLAWLQANRPAEGTVSLLHGDYRPKNILWHEGQIAAIIDWAYVDWGDPYYDLSIIHWYLRGEEEWQGFLAAYGLTGFDRQRFAFYLALHKFLNV